MLAVADVDAGGANRDTGTAIGAVFAALVFALSAVAIPMLLEREVDVITAIITSIVAVQRNWRPMALPLLGHASWHAYKDLVE